MSYSSHYPILAACIARTDLPILELGCGEGSTPMIHYAAPYHYKLSADTDEAWIKKYSMYKSDAHRFEVVRPSGDESLPLVTRMIQGWREWAGADKPEPFMWGVVFIDCAPGEARHELAIRVAEYSEYVVCHDSETDYASGGNYMYDKAKPHFKFVSEFRRFRPYTLIMSNYHKFNIVEADQTWEPPQ